MNCPQCNGSDIVLIPGNTLKCTKCNIIFHECVDGIALGRRLGCRKCCIKRKELLIERGVRCRCGHTNTDYNTGEIVDDGGSRVCNGCYLKYHICQFSLVQYGSPGPDACKYCKEEREREKEEGDKENEKTNDNTIV